MAHLEVEPKPARPWWVWALIVILLLVLAGLLIKKCGSDATTTNADTTAIDTNITPVAATTPDWSNIDFNAAASTDADISDTDIQTRNGETYTIYSLGENILFATGGDNLSESGQSKLRMISDVLQKRFEGATIGVFGSTDATGPTNENIALGKQRAEAVKNWLVTSGNLPGEQISVQSLGETDPVATNNTKDGRQQNRNVSIVVFPKQ